MANNYEDYKPLNPMPPRKRRSQVFSFAVFFVIFLLTIAVVVTGCLFVTSHYSGKNTSDETLPEKTETKTPSRTEPIQTEPVETEPTETGPSQPVVDPSEYYTELEVTKDQVHKGELILVNNVYNYVFPEKEDVVQIYGTNKGYSLAGINISVKPDALIHLNEMMAGFVEATGKRDVIVSGAYRSKEEQQRIYDNYAEKYGTEKADLDVAKAGASDHNTGYGIDFKIYADGMTSLIADKPEYAWLEQNCHKYGFVLRYPDEHASITGMTYDTSLYLRYVGIPAANVIKNNSMCLETFEMRIKDYRFDTEHYNIDLDDGKTYEIYYCPVEGETAKIFVPKNKNYTISGNNMDGVIVVAEK